MQTIRRGLLLAALSVVALTLGASSAVAGPISGPFTGSGSIRLDGGLGSSDCSSFTFSGTAGGTDDYLTVVRFASCTGALGTPTALASTRLPWAIAWNSRITGGSTTTTILLNASGLATCLYSGRANFTYNGSTRVMTLNQPGVPLLSQLSGLPICPDALDVTGSITLSY